MSLYCKGENCPKSKDCLRAEEYRNYVKAYGIPKDGEDIGIYLVWERNCVDEGYSEGVFSKKEPNMSRAEEKALEIYPICKHSNYGYKDLNEDKRRCYIEGYEQAEKDFMEKAEKWWHDHLVGFLKEGLTEGVVNEFKQFMREQ